MNRGWTIVMALTAMLVSTSLAAQVKVRVRSSNRVPAERQAESPHPSGSGVTPVTPTEAEAKRIDHWIDELGAATLAKRERAMSEIASFGAKAIQAVRDNLEHENDEIAYRCQLLDTMLSRGNAALFLAARRLGVTEAQLTKMMADKDVTPLLSLMRQRAKRGMTSLWAHILKQLSTGTRIYPAVRACIDVEGPDGYSDTLAKAGERDDLTDKHASGLARAISYFPCNDPMVASRMFARGWSTEAAIKNASYMRGQWTQSSLINALRELAKIKPDDDAFVWVATQRAVLLATMPTLDSTPKGLPPLRKMAPFEAREYMRLLARSNRNKTLESVILKLMSQTAKGSTQYWAGVSLAESNDASTVFELMPALPLTMRAGVWDQWWLMPPDPIVLQPLLIKSLQPDGIGGLDAIRLLSGMRAKSTATALATVALDRPPYALAALGALRGMADLLPNTGETWTRLVGWLDSASGDVRLELLDLLARANDDTTNQMLVARWNTNLLRDELEFAVRVLAHDDTTPAGAMAHLISRGNQLRSPLSNEINNLSINTWMLMRELLARNSNDGVTYLLTLAESNTSDARSYRGNAASILAWMGKDTDQIAAWIQEFSNPESEIGSGYLGAVMFSRTQAAEDYRNDMLKREEQLAPLLISKLYGRTKISWDALLKVAFRTYDDFENNSNFLMLLPELDRDLLARRMEAQLFPSSDDRNEVSANSVDFDSFAWILRYKRAGLDPADLLFKDAKTAEITLRRQVRAIGLLSSKDRAKALFANIPDDKNGEKFIMQLEAKVHLDQAPDSVRWILAGDGRGVLPSYYRMQQANQGDINALRALLDSLGRQHLRRNNQSTLGVTVTPRRWGGVEYRTVGLAAVLFQESRGNMDFPPEQLSDWFNQPVPVAWSGWWQARRGLARFNQETGKFEFVELP